MRRTSVIAIVLSTVALAAAAFGVWYSTTTTQTAAVGKSLAEQITEICSKGGAAAAELGPNGACAKAAQVQDQPAIAQTAVDPEALRQAARTAVAEYCAAPNRPCRGSDGATPNLDLIVDAVVGRIPAPKNGADGASATTAQVAEVVAGYCGQASEPCRGTPGTPGADGKDGKDGRDGVDGQPGPTCPEGYELHDAVITARDGTTYSGKACVDPNSSAPPSSSKNPPPLSPN